MNARKLAVEAIDKILDKDAYSNIIVNEYLTKYELSNEDKSLFTNLVYGTLQNLLTIEYYLKPYLKKKPKHFIMNLLSMSVYQLVYMNIPEYAVLDESVKIARLKDSKLASFVNGVLRNFLRNPLPDLEEIKTKDGITKYLSIKYSHPEWLIVFFLKDYSIEDVEKILIENNKVKYDAIRINTLKTTKEEVIRILNELNVPFEDASAVTNGLIIKKPIFETNLFRDGYVTIQDISSQMVGEIASPEMDSTVIDLCSAPGGKTAHLAAWVNNTGTIYACDVHQHKIKLMEKNFKRLGVENVKTQLIDAREVYKKVKEESFDYVICDVPCSGLGVMSHKCDLKYNITYDSIQEIIKLQREILDASYPLIKKGGYLTVSTCTINKSENEEQINYLLEKYKDLTVEYQKTILPFEYGTDGFFICKLKKEK